MQVASLVDLGLDHAFPVTEALQPHLATLADKAAQRFDQVADGATIGNRALIATLSSIAAR
jgi:hypothetical protein